ncbi:Protein dopey [Nakaseomyces bracarensis]|uniref:Protein dopey n=1 Tax=Nakaseomyces bracarensis TaxID=273131 RepID=A0ABR4NWP3_9SACH
MSLPLRPLALDSNSKQLDSKQKKFCSQVEKAIKKFDLVVEWADYISSLGTLLKALQSWSPKFQNVQYFVPFPYDVSRRLASSLSPSLPAGVHLKALEVYTYIFENIGQVTLANEVNIWIPGILPLMAYASMSVRSQVIELYETYILQLRSNTLKVIIKPLIASMFPGIEDESSEFLRPTLKLIEILKENLDDDPLFWQTCFIVISNNPERRAGGLVWLTKYFPSLNAIPHKVVELKNRENSNSNSEPNKSTSSLELSERKKIKEDAFSILLPAAKDLVTPEPGLLIRCLVSCLKDENDILIKRGILELLLQRIRLDSPVLQTLISQDDRKLLIMSCCETTLSKDMSLNRRVWNWLLGVSSSTNRTNESSATSFKNQTQFDNIKSESDTVSDYFKKNGLVCLTEGLKDLLKEDDGIILAYKLCLSIMDRWEIGSLIIPDIFIDLLLAAYNRKSNKVVLNSSSRFFDAVETNIIWGKIFQYFIKHKELGLLQFVLSNFNIASDEEIVVRHLPLLLLTLLSVCHPLLNESTFDHSRFYEICHIILSNIPERGFLPISQSRMTKTGIPNETETIKIIETFYNKVSNPLENMSSDDINIQSPFKSEDLTYLIISHLQEILLEQIKSGVSLQKVTNLYISFYDKIPEIDEPNDNKIWSDALLIEYVFDSLNTQMIYDLQYFSGLVDIYSNYLSKRINLLQSVKLLTKLIQTLWFFLTNPRYQDTAIKCIESFERAMPTEFVESAVAGAFAKEQSIKVRIDILNLLWCRLSSSSTIYERPLEIVLDELNDVQNPYYLIVSKWVYSVLSNGSINNLFNILVNQLTVFDLFKREQIYDTDDLEMFTYRIQLLRDLLITNNGTLMKSFKSELSPVNSTELWKDEDVSTYKNLTIAILLKFLQKRNNNHPKSIRSALVLLDNLLDGSETNFKDIVIFLLEKSSIYISEGELEGELIAVALINIVSKVLRLSHQNGIKLDIFDDNSTHMKYIDYLVTTVSSMSGPLIVTAYVQLLSESIVYFESSIFRMLLPLSASMVQCVQRLFILEKEQGGYYESISLLLNGLEELLEVSHGYLIAGENESFFGNNSSRSDFLQSMVSNVFSSENNNIDIKIQGERDVVVQSFKQVINCTFEIWLWSHSQSSMVSPDAIQHASYTSYKFKFKTKNIMEKLYFLEPSEVLEALINLKKEQMIIILLQSLDGNRPALTIPYFFVSIVLRCNRSSTVKFSRISSINKGQSNKIAKMDPSLLNKLSVKTIMHYLLKYTEVLENTSVEDFYTDFIAFLKEVATNQYAYKDITLDVFEFCSIIAQKMAMSKFGDEKRARKELADTFLKYFSSAIEAISKNKIEYPEIVLSLQKVVRKTGYIVNEDASGDKLALVYSAIINNIIVPNLKGHEKIINLRDFKLLLLELSKHGAKVKQWKQAIQDAFYDNNLLSTIFKDDIWKNVISEWSGQSDVRDRLLAELLPLVITKKTSLAPTAISFNAWGDSETEGRKKNILRIAFLLNVGKTDQYLLYFQQIINFVLQYLISNESDLKAMCWLLFRVLLLKFSQSHFNEHWGMITSVLQNNLQEFFENLQIQEQVDPNNILQLCKTLDMLLVLSYEGFCATNEWIFIIDTINCIYKTNSFVALVDEISTTREYEITTMDDLDITTNTSSFRPLLLGVHSINRHNQLRSFFQNLSYVHYERNYGLHHLNYDDIQKDVALDIYHQAE